MIASLVTWKKNSRLILLLITSESFNLHQSLNECKVFKESHKYYLLKSFWASLGNLNCTFKWTQAITKTPVFHIWIIINRCCTPKSFSMPPCAGVVCFIEIFKWKYTWIFSISCNILASFFEFNYNCFFVSTETIAVIAVIQANWVCDNLAVLLPIKYPIFLVAFVCAVVII